MTKQQGDKKPKKFNFRKLKHLPKILNKIERKTIYALLGIIVVCLGFLIYFGYPKFLEPIPKNGGQYTEGIVGKPKFINPVFSSANDVDSDITRLVFRGLMKYNSNQELVPDIAESYEISKDKQNYIFHLKESIKWHDDKPLTADDIVFTVQTIKNPEYQSPLQINFEGVIAEKIDDYTVKFTLNKTKYTPFLTENTIFGIIPKHIWENIPPKNASLAEQNLVPTGCGPFKFKEYKKDKTTGAIISYTLEKFENYYDKKSYIDEIAFEFFNDYPELIKAYNKKQIQGIGYIPIEEQDNIKKKINLLNLKLPHYYSIFFNTNRNEATQYKPVRKALAHATDKERIIKEALNEQAIVIDSPILSNFPEYYPDIKKYNYDPQKAKKILKKAGWTKKNKTLWLENTKLELTLTIINEPEFIQIAEIIKENWQEIGAKIHIEAIEPTELQSAYIRPRKYQALLYGQLLGHDPDPYPFWHSSQNKDPGLNLTSIKRTSIDKLLEAARQEGRPKERKKSYKKFQEIITEEVPAISLYSPTYLYGQTNKIKGQNLKFIFTPSDRFSDIENWYIKTKLKFKNKK